MAGRTPFPYVLSTCFRGLCTDAHRLPPGCLIITYDESGIPAGQNHDKLRAVVAHRSVAKLADPATDDELTTTQRLKTGKDAKSTAKRQVKRSRLDVPPNQPIVHVGQDAPNYLLADPNLHTRTLNIRDG